MSQNNVLYIHKTGNLREYLSERFKNGRTVPGTRGSHHFIPKSISTISHFLTSEEPEPAATFNFDSVPEEINVNPTVGSFITCIYDSYWWVGLVDSVSKEHSDCEQL